MLDDRFIDDAVINDFGTVKILDTSLSIKSCDALKDEMSIDELFTKLEDGINDTYLSVDEKIYGDNYLNFKTYIKKAGDNEYYINLDDYNIFKLKLNKNNFYYSEAKKKLEEICKKEEEKRNKNNIIKSFETGQMIKDEDSYKVYYDYLNNKKSQLKKRLRKYLSKLFFGIGGITLSLLLSIILIAVGSVALAMCTIPIIVVSAMFIADSSFDKEIINSYINAYKINKSKLDRVIKKLNYSKSITLDNKEENNIENNIDIDNVYKNSVIKYMDSIMKGASSLNKNDKKAILIELREVLDEYTSKMVQLNNSSNNRLSLNNNERMITIDTLDKLTTLEMKLAKLKNQDIINSKIYSESDILKEKLDRLIEEDNQEESLELKLERSH